MDAERAPGGQARDPISLLKSYRAAGRRRNGLQRVVAYFRSRAVSATVRTWHWSSCVTRTPVRVQSR
jgi:hypothetical protein